MVETMKALEQSELPCQLQLCLSGGANTDAVHGGPLATSLAIAVQDGSVAPASGTCRAGGGGGGGSQRCRLTAAGVEPNAKQSERQAAARN